eukprot:CAMPEP_0118949420 /NCGR_PEP_ID=MMETSP1169-20130426/49592_1 /TAXON_ID=36882 /ORGANISM="Pyramimonas obovata, Strain CCMP722" /LENGTH=66 /DNA_ID=CAMNT_0006896047 /DNA_START=147 /DNA_END=344 /DNA_ORIENTATION=+
MSCLQSALEEDQSPPSKRALVGITLTEMQFIKNLTDDQLVSDREAAARLADATKTTRDAQRSRLGW